MAPFCYLGLLLVILVTPVVAFAECAEYKTIETENSIEVICVGHEPIKKIANEMVMTPQEKPQKSDSKKGAVVPLSNFIKDNEWVVIDLGAFEAFGINNSAVVAGNVLTENSSFAAIWKNGFIERLDGPFVTTSSSANAINDSGQVVGHQIDFADKTQRAVFWNGEVLQKLGDSDGSRSSAIAINNSGDVVGWVTPKDNNYPRDLRVFIWKSGTKYLLKISDEKNKVLNVSHVAAFNDGGQIIADNYLFDTSLKSSIDKFDEKTFTAVPSKIKLDFRATCMNNAGQVVGLREHAMFLFTDNSSKYTDNTVESIHNGAQTGSFNPIAINKNGIIVGNILSGVAIWKDGVVTRLNDYSLWSQDNTITEARGINDLGQFIVFAKKYPGGPKSFLLTPKENVPISDSGQRIKGFSIRAPQLKTL